MPFDKLDFPRKITGTTVNFPFALTISTVDVNSNAIFITKDDFDCACPCNSFVPPVFITSSQMIYYTNFLNDNPSPTIVHASTQNNKLAVSVSSTSYLYKGLLPPKDYNSSDPIVAQYGLNADPTQEIFGLSVPIILDGFLNLAQPTSMKTLKIWLTCCYASGETAPLDPPAYFDTCAAQLDSGDSPAVEPNYPQTTPQIAFISAGLYWPANLSVRKLVNKGTLQQPFYDRRTIEAHVPIGEIGSDGTVKVQYLKNNLVLADMCINGAPVKFPMCMFNELAILPSTFV